MSHHRHRHRLATAGLVATSTLLGFLLAAAAGEALVRQRERTRESVPGTMPFLYYEHNRYRTALVRDTDYFGWARVNKSGFRGAETHEAKASGSYRIMAVGSSTTFDTAIGDDEATWPAVLERRLDSLSGGASVEVINAGVAGYRVIDNLIRLQMELHRFRPDLILLYEGHNDLFRIFVLSREAPAETRTPGRIKPKSGWQSWLEQRSLLYSKVTIMVKLRAFNRRANEAERRTVKPAEEWELILRRGGDEYARDLSSFVAVARTMGIPVAIPQLAHVSGAGARVDSSRSRRASWANAVGAPAEVVLRGYAIFDSVARDVAARTGATYVPTAEFAPSGDSLYAPGDPIHFAPRGAELMALGLADALMTSGAVATLGAAEPRDLPRPDASPTVVLAKKSVTGRSTGTVGRANP